LTNDFVFVCLLLFLFQMCDNRKDDLKLEWTFFRVKIWVAQLLLLHDAAIQLCEYCTSFNPDNLCKRGIRPSQRRSDFDVISLVIKYWKIFRYREKEFGTFSKLL